MNNEIIKLINEDISLRSECEFCRESNLEVNKLTEYGGMIMFRIGETVQKWVVCYFISKNRWRSK